MMHSLNPEGFLHPTTLFAVCKQLQKETASIFYTKSTFEILHPGALAYSLNTLSRVSRNALGMASQEGLVE